MRGDCQRVLFGLILWDVLYDFSNWQPVYLSWRGLRDLCEWDIQGRNHISCAIVSLVISDKDSSALSLTSFCWWANSIAATKTSEPIGVSFTKLTTTVLTSAMSFLIQYSISPISARCSWIFTWVSRLPRIVSDPSVFCLTRSPVRYDTYGDLY